MWLFPANPSSRRNVSCLSKIIKHFAQTFQPSFVLQSCPFFLFDRLAHADAFLRSVDSDATADLGLNGTLGPGICVPVLYVLSFLKDAPKDRSQDWGLKSEVGERKCELLA